MIAITISFAELRESENTYMPASENVNTKDYGTVALASKLGKAWKSP